MNQSKPYTTLRHVLSSILMLVLLAWLTVCLPVVNHSQKLTKAQTEQSGNEAQSEESNPLTNTNEEKTESGTSVFSDYLHDLYSLEHNFISLSTFYKCHPSNLYLAYHPDLLIPPPEV